MAPPAASGADGPGSSDGVPVLSSGTAVHSPAQSFVPLDCSDELATNGRPRLRLNERLRADGRSLCWCCALSERNRGNEQHSEAKRCPHNVVLKKGVRPQKSAHQLVGARQILQCVGKIKIGSSAQALYHPPNFRRQGKPNGIMPVLSSSPTSKSQSSGASWIGSHRRARHDIPESLKGA